MIKTHKMTHRMRFCPYSFILFLVVFSQTGCFGKKSGFTPESRTPRPLTVTKIQDQSSSEWKKDSNGKVYVRLHTINIQGICTSGNAIKGLVNQVALPILSCPSGTYSATFNVPADGTYQLAFNYDGANGTPANKVTQTIEVDTVAPDPPTITTNGGNPYIIESHTFDIQGTLSSDTIALDVNDFGNLHISLPLLTFTLSTSLSPSQEKTYSIRAIDFAGNYSTPAEIRVNYLTLTQLTTTDFSGLAQTTSITGSTYQLTFSSTNPFVISPNGVSSTGGTTLYPGFIHGIPSGNP